MNYEQILADIATRYHDEPDIVFLAARAATDPAARKQLADAVCSLPARLSPGVIYEIAKWGTVEELSRCRELRR